MAQNVQFVAKVSKIKTRTKESKDYYAYRLNIPSEIAEKLQLTNNDFLFVREAIKAEWYHLFKWNENPKAWEKLPPKLQNEITSSGIISLPPRTLPSPMDITASIFVVHSENKRLLSPNITATNYASKKPMNVIAPTITN
jgi:hypothetical protein